MQMRMSIRLFSDDGVKGFGKGVSQLLHQIEKTGSLNAAAKSMNLAYSKAWKMLHAAEEQLGMVFVVRKSGGKNGGGSTLTPEGHLFLQKYDAFVAEAEEEVGVLFHKTFP